MDISLDKTSTKKSLVEKSWYVPVIMFLSAYLMYVLALLPIFIKRGLPFFYYGDYNVQQVPFYMLAHRAVRNGEFFWNWNADLGGTMFGDFAFYLWGSPFFWLTVPFPESAIPYMMPFLMALKYAVSATCAYVYIRKYVHKYTYAMIGGYLYAFSGFNACNIVFNHFTDAVAFFPLFMLLFDKLMNAPVKVDGKFKFSGKPFIAFALITAFMSVINYYFFFGQVIFLIIYFVIRYVDLEDKELVAVRFGRALAGGLVGVLFAGFFLMQAFVGVQGNTRLNNYINGYDMLVYPSEKLIFDIVKSLSMLPDIIGKGTLFYTGTVKNASLAAYLPLFGISGVVAFYLQNRKKKSWQKTLITVCAVMAFIPVLNAAFSLFNSAYYARWFYMPILIMCLMTAMAAERGKSIHMKKGAVTAVIMFLFFVAVYLLPSKNDKGDIVFMNMTENVQIFLRDLMGSAILSFMLLVTVFAIPKKFKFEKSFEEKKVKSNISYRDRIVLGIVIASCIVSTFIPVYNGSSIISDKGKQKWQDQMLFTKVNVDQTSFCRGEVDSTSTNYDMAWGIPSVHCFLSTVPSEIFDFLEGTAGITRTVETNLPINRAGIRAILSSRYYMENAIISRNRVFNDGDGTEGYSFRDNQNGFDIFENANYIPMGFAYDYYITEDEWKDLEASDYDYELARVVIISTEDAVKYGDKLDMEEIKAEELSSGSLTYSGFKEECAKRKKSTCTSFVTDTYGFSAKTTNLDGGKLVFFSVPATEGFSCTVDGEPTEIVKADYGLMAIPVSAGVHDIRVTYEPEGLKAGLAMSIVGALILVIYSLYTLKIIKKND